jgi:hypothetical protein
MNFPENWETNCPPKPTENFYLVKYPTVGNLYHCSWAKNKSMVWRLVEINGNNCTLETPRTHKIVETQLSSLRETEKQARKNTYIKNY